MPPHRKKCLIKRLTPEQLTRHGAMLREVGRDELGLAGQNTYLWKPNTKLGVYFMDPEVYGGMYDDVLQLASRWSLHGSITFERVSGWSAADISVAFKGGDGWYSLVGTQSKGAAKDKQPSMNLDPDEGIKKGFMKGTTEKDRYCKGSIRHEFGHALGFIHEHQRDDRPFTWNTKWVRKNYSKLGLPSYEAAQDNFIKTDPGPYNKSKFDFMSVMIYEWPAAATNEGVSSKTSDNLSRLDRQQMRIVYPK